MALSKFLRKNNVKTQVARKKKLLSQSDIQQGISFSQHLREFKIEMLNLKVFTDESSISIGGGRTYVRLKGSNDAFQREKNVHHLK